MIQETHDLKAVGGRLVAVGKVLEDDEKTLDAYGIKDAGTIIVMPRKDRPQKKEEAKAEDPKPVVDLGAGASAATGAASANPPAQTATNPPA